MSGEYMEKLSEICDRNLEMYNNPPEIGPYTRKLMIISGLPLKEPPERGIMGCAERAAFYERLRASLEEAIQKESGEATKEKDNE